MALETVVNNIQWYNMEVIYFFNLRHKNILTQLESVEGSEFFHNSVVLSISLLFCKNKLLQCSDTLN